MTPTERLLLRLARIHLSDDDLARARADAPEADWPELARWAVRGGIAGIVEQSVGRLAASGTPVPREVRLRLAAAALSTAQANLPVLAEARRLCSKARGFSLIPLKGTALYLTGRYPDPAFRTMADLDLLTGRSEIAIADAFLLGEGYTYKGDQTPYRRYLHHLVYKKKVAHREVMVELQFTPHGVMFGDPRLDERIISRARAAGGVLQLSPEDELLTVAVHFAVHRFRAQLKWLVDVAEILRAHPALDWGRIEHDVRAIGAHRSFSYALAMARELLDAPAPLLDSSRGARLMRFAAPPEAVLHSLAQGSWASRALLNLLQFDSPLGGARYLVHKGAELVERHTGIRVPRLFALKSPLTDRSSD